jgi:hypothetical protein
VKRSQVSVAVGAIEQANVWMIEINGGWISEQGSTSAGVGGEGVVSMVDVVMIAGRLCRWRTGWELGSEAMMTADGSRTSC